MPLLLNLARPAPPIWKHMISLTCCSCCVLCGVLLAGAAARQTTLLPTDSSSTVYLLLLLLLLPLLSAAAVKGQSNRRPPASANTAAWSSLQQQHDTTPTWVHAACWQGPLHCFTASQPFDSVAHSAMTTASLTSWVPQQQSAPSCSAAASPWLLLAGRHTGLSASQSSGLNRPRSQPPARCPPLQTPRRIP